MEYGIEGPHTAVETYTQAEERRQSQRELEIRKPSDNPQTCLKGPWIPHFMAAGRSGPFSLILQKRVTP